MVKFMKAGALLALVEQPNWVYLMDNGVYGLCPLDEAQGVALGGTVYNLAGHAISENGEVAFSEIETGEYLMEQDRAAAQTAANVDYLSMMSGIDLPTEAESEVTADE